MGAVPDLPKKDVEAAALAKLLAHPLRVRIVVAMSPGNVVSPVDLAERFEESLGNVSYHVTKLYKAGLVTLVDERPARGAMEHFYSIQTESWDQLASLIGTLSNVYRSVTAPATE